MQTRTGQTIHHKIIRSLFVYLTVMVCLRDTLKKSNFSRGIMITIGNQSIRPWFRIHMDGIVPVL